MEEDFFTIQLTFQEGRKLGLVLIDRDDEQLDRHVPTSPSARILDGALRSVKTAVATAATNVAAQVISAFPVPSRPNKNKRKREIQICVSPRSVVFTFAAKLLDAAKALDFEATDFDKMMAWGRANSPKCSFCGIEYSLASFNEQSLMYALTGTVKPFLSIEKIQYRKASVAKSCNLKHNKTTRPIGGRRSWQYFRSDYFDTLLCCNSTNLKQVTDILSCSRNYPLYITFKQGHATKNIDPIVTANSSDMGPPRKRKRTKINNDTQQNQTKSDVICLLDRADDEVEEDRNDNTEANSNETNDSIQQSFSTMSIEPHQYTVPNDPPQLPFEEDDFILTPYGPGKILASRVERRAFVTNNDATIFKPIRIYSVDLHFGTCHIPANQIRSIGTSYEKTFFTYQKVPLNEHDLLRLRPMTFLNDSIINFYLKFVKSQVDAVIGATATKSEERSWDNLDGSGIHIFPSYCYTKIQTNLNGNRNSKANRERIWKDLKSWTKCVDIFKKRLLVFPINDSLHWTVCVVFHPGRLVRNYSLEVVEKKKDPQLRQLQALKERKKKIWAKRDATSPRASKNGVTPLSLLSLLDDDDCPVQPESNDDVALDDNKTENTPPASRPAKSYQAEHATAPTESSAEETKDGPEWQCDFCAAKYTLFDLALEHETTCDENIKWCMAHFDSGKHFNLHKSTEILGNIRQYLNAYYEAEYKSTHPGVAFTTKTMPGFSAAVPQQDNVKDCGVYMLEIAERVMRNSFEVDFEFIEMKGASKNDFFGKGNSFNKDVIVQKREDILQLLNKLRREETSLC